MKIRQYCSVCKAEYDMEVVPAGDGDDDPVVWLRCPSCEGYLPKIRDSKAFRKDAAPEAEDTAGEADTAPASLDAPGEDREAADAGPAEPPDADAADAAARDRDAPAPEAESDADTAARLLDAADLEQAVPYRPWQTYAVGDVIHHLAWDDYGVVLAKETLPGNRQVVKVHFGKAGTVRLIENDGSRP